MKTKEPLLRSDWTIFRGGAVLFKDSRNCETDLCSFTDIGSNGVFVDGSCSNISVTRTHFRDIGASAVCFVGKPDSVRSPLFEYNETHSVKEIDLTPGPASDNYPRNCRVEDCLIEHVGLTEKQATGVEISMSYGITVKNCTICHTSRAGLNISEGTFGGHRIEGCDIFDTVRETGDHGSFNSWGRDRYWHLRDLDDKDAYKYATLDIISPTVITRNRFRCDHGWDIDLDDGSSCYEISCNLCLNGGIKLREGFYRTVRNNICINNGLHVHVWYPDSGDVVENNIFFKSYSPIMMPETWGKSINGNILHRPGTDKTLHADELSVLSGQDSDSIMTDAHFSVLSSGSVHPANPCISGYDCFPSEFGVRYAPLRRMADKPIFPDFIVSEAKDESRTAVLYNGILLCDIESDDEMSAFGTAGHDGVRVLSVIDSDSLQPELRVNDIITSVDDRVIRSVDDLNGIPAISRCISVLRNQNPITLIKKDEPDT